MEGIRPWLDELGNIGYAEATLAENDFKPPALNNSYADELLESGDLASVSAVTGHCFGLIPSLMYIVKGLAPHM